MKPIINPWVIYFANISDKFITLFAILGAICIIATLIICFAHIDQEGKVFINKKTLIGGILFIIASIIIPSTETIYTLVAVNELTPNNIQAIGKTGKDVVDYITDQIDKVVNDKDEEKEED